MIGSAWSDVNQNLERRAPRWILALAGFNIRKISALAALLAIALLALAQFARSAIFGG